jgi:hypothetical protein
LGGANVIVKVGDGNISALLFGLANIVTHVGDGDNYLLMLGMYNIATKVKTLAPAKRYRIELPEPSLLILFAPPAKLAFKIPCAL